MPKETYSPLDTIFGHIAFIKKLGEERPECVGCEHIRSTPYCDGRIYKDIIKPEHCLSCPKYSGGRK